MLRANHSRSTLAASLRDLILGFHHWECFPDFDATYLRAHHLLCEVDDPGCRDCTRNPAGVNVRDQVAVGIRVTRIGLECHVRRQAFSSGEARTFANQQHDDFRAQQLANVIDHSHAAIMRCKRLAEDPSAALALFKEER